MASWLPVRVRVREWLQARLERSGARLPPPHYLTVCAVIKDEGRYLLEWLAFHRAAGVDHFLLYDNDSSDETPAIVAAFERAFPGSITLIAWPGQAQQWKVYEDAINRRLPKLSRWAAFIDGDEFLYGVSEDLKDIMRSFEAVSCLCVYWLVFGSSGHVEAPEGLCIENFRRCASRTSKANGRYKSIAKVSRLKGRAAVHLMPVWGRVVDEGWNDIDRKAGRSPKGLLTRVRINHYIVKSHAEWRVKQARGLATARDGDDDRYRPDSFFAENDRNERQDKVALRFAPEVKAMMAIVAAAEAADAPTNGGFSG